MHLENKLKIFNDTWKKIDGVAYDNRKEIW